MSVASHVKGDVNALPAIHLGIDLILQPVVRDLPLNDLDIVGEPGAEITTPTCDTEAALCAARIKASIRAAHRAAFAERRLIGFLFWSGLRFFLGRSGN